MQCEKHPHSDAVAQCAGCGSYVCSSCAENTKELRESFGILCLDCYVHNLSVAAYGAGEAVKRRKAILIGKGTFYFVGILLLLFGPGTGGPIYALVGLLLCGIFGAISGWKEGTRNHEEEEAKNGATYYITDTGIYRDKGTVNKLIFAIVYCLFGVIATPFSCISDIFKIKESANLKIMFENEISRINALDDTDTDID